MEALLTEEQKRVVETPGSLLVIAGPGTGKTFTLIKKVKNLLESESPEDVVVLSYSLKVSRELKEKFSKEGLDSVKVDTFHGFAYDIWRDYYQKNPPLISEDEKKDILKKLFPRQKSPLKTKEGLKAYRTFLKEKGLLDFELLLLETIPILKHLSLPKFLVIDEFQDMGEEILEFLKGFPSSNFVFFGDPNQAIYSFKGVDLLRIRDFLEGIPDLKRLHLTKSFRCREEILKVAERFKESPWKVPSYKPLVSGGSVEGFELETPYQEADFLAKKVKELIGGLQLEEQRLSDVAPGDIFILSRIRQAAAHVREVFEDQGIPVNSVEAQAEELKKEIEGFLKNMENPLLDAETAISSAPREVKGLLKNLWELSNRDEEKFKVYLEAISLEDLFQVKKEGVNFLSIHSSKGLEAEYVFLVGAENGLIPLKLFKDTREDEEKRLLYVAITRAKSAFYFTSTKRRKIFNFTLKHGTSRYLADLPITRIKKPPKKPKQVGLF